MYSDHAAYGVRNSRPVHISEVQRGLACGCACAECGRPLVARKGDSRRHHFAHHEPTTCGGGPETLLHLLAKEIFAELTTIRVPAYGLVLERSTPSGTPVKRSSVISEETVIAIKGSQAEHLEAGVRPDIILDSDSGKLLVEIAVFHRVGRTKLRKLRRRGLPAIEICLPPEDAYLPRERLASKLEQDLRSKFWLFHPSQRQEERAFLAELRKSRSHERRRMALAPAPPAQRTGGRHIPFVPTGEAGMAPAEYDRRTERFFAKYGRYPSLEECQRLWSPYGWRGL